MTVTEINTLVKNETAKALNIRELGTQIDTYTWAIPIETPEGIRYAKVSIVAAQATANKRNPAFDLGAAEAAFAEKKAERAEKAAAKAKK